jgi:hypothetical protein
MKHFVVNASGRVAALALALWVGFAGDGLAKQNSIPVRGGLTLVFDASNIDGQGNATLLDGAEVSSWKDLSGRGQGLTGHVGTPTYIQPGPGFGGLPVAEFNPGDFDGPDYLYRAASPITSYPFTIFAVVKSDTTSNGVVFSLVDSGARDKMVGIRFTSDSGEPGKLSLFRRNTKWIETASARSYNDNELHVVSARFISSSQARLYVDGGEVAASSANVSLPRLNRFDLGHNGRAGRAPTDPLDGQIAELILYEVDVSGNDRQAVEHYLMQKWISGPPDGGERPPVALERTAAASRVGAANDRVPVSDYDGYTVTGNRITFDLEGAGEVRVDLNTSRMARVRFSPDGDFRSDEHPDYFMVQKFDWDPVAFAVADRGDHIEIQTADLTIRAMKSPFRLQMFDGENRTLLSADADDLGMYSAGGQRGVLRKEGGTNNARFGFGSGYKGESRPLNKAGGYDQFSMGAQIPDSHGRTIVPMFMSTAGYGIFLNTVEHHTSFDAKGGFETANFLDYWFMAGDFRDVLGLYSELTGRMNLFPKWAYGFMLSKYGNDDATQPKFSEWIHRLRDEDYPTDVYVFDYGWRGGKHNAHEWDTNRFPDLDSMFSEARQLGFHIGLHNNYGTLQRHCDTDQNPSTEVSFTNPDVADAWWHAHWDRVVKPGCGDFFWPDEFDNRSRDMSINNLMADRAAKVVHERWLEETVDQRPMFMTRGGWAGHHFATTWSGDIENTVSAMADQITGSVALGLSGYPWTSNDLGGFIRKPSDELYMRWVAQFGAFSAMMRTHGHDGREPWLYSPAAQENLRKYLKIRYRLFPYIYTSAWQGAREGIPMMRAMALDYGDDPESWLQENQYFFGDWLLVAPALSTAATTVDIWLPKGTWVDFFDPSIRYEGGKTITVTADLDEIPVLVREGAIIPTGPEISYADEFTLDPLSLELYPGSKPTSYTLYEDDGISRRYLLENARCLTTFHAEWPQPNTLVFTKDAAQIGNPAVYSPDLPRALVLRANRWSAAPQVVSQDGTPLPKKSSEKALASAEKGWFWSAPDQLLLIRVVDDGRATRVVASEPLIGSEVVR